MSKSKRILITPLDWGLGHASRCIPIIRLLLKHDFEVIIGASGKPYQLLTAEFPELESVVIPDFVVEYAPHGNFMGHFVRKLPEMLVQVQKENSILKQLIKKLDIDMVISDNRFGMQNSNVKSIIITHQLEMQLPWGNKAANWINRKMLNRFDEIWIPDFDGKNRLAGKLSKKNPYITKKVRYLGPLSRFQTPPNDVIMDLDFVAVVSGPEPQRTIIDKIIQNQTEHTYLSGVIVQGLPGEERYYKIRDGLMVYNHLNSEALGNMMHRAKVIVGRAGYSTIMDLSIMGKPAVLIPTPGQPEQEYLAHYLKNNEQFIFVKQKHLNLPRLLSRSFPPIRPSQENGLQLMQEAIDSL